MRSNTIPSSILVGYHVPSYVLEENPVFIQFLQNYYEYLDQAENINDYIRNIIGYMDIDDTSAAFLNDFFEELKAFPKDIAVDKRLLAKHIRELYETKGSIESFQILFRILFGEEISVTIPSENILRTSDGNWSQEYFFTLNKTFGSIDDGTLPQFHIENSYGLFIIQPTRIIHIDASTTRVYYDFKTYVRFEENQIVNTYDSIGSLKYAGTVVGSPWKILIDRPGKFWQRGDIIVVPSGSAHGVDTIARVTLIDTDSGIASLEIIQHGYPHFDNQIAVVSPFTSKPTSSAVNLTVVDGLFNTDLGVAYAHYTLTIDDYTDGFSETITGVSTGGSALDKYALSDYFEEIYVGSAVINQSVSNIIPHIDSGNESGVGIEDWLASRTYLRYDFANLVKTKGRFEDERGQLSNQAIRLQDSFYYQVFSYVIQTEHEVSKYKNALALVHPAGLKFFAELSKNFEAEVVVGVERSISNDQSYFNDIANTSDGLNLEFLKGIIDSIYTTESTSLSLTKPFDDAVVASDDDSLTLTKPFSETLSASDSLSLVPQKNFADTVSSSDDDTLDVTKTLTESVGISDSDSLSLDKYIQDSVSATEGSTDYQVNTYFAGDYSASGDYSTKTHTLTIS